MTWSLSANIFIYFILTALPVHALDSQALIPERIIRQELLVNNLIINLYLLKIDFQDNNVREEIDESVVLFGNNLAYFSDMNLNSEAKYILEETKMKWPLIREHTQWVLGSPKDALPTKLDSVIAALVKLERKLLILRQISLTEIPMASHKLRFLEQALLMQAMTREYLSLASVKKTLLINRGQQALKAMSERFSSKMGKITQAFIAHPHAKEPAKKASQAWSVIAKSIDSFPKKPVPALVALYSDLIISQLSSIHNMF